MKVSYNKPFILQIAQHHFNSKTVYDKHVQQGECLSYSLQILTLKIRSLCAGKNPLALCRQQVFSARRNSSSIAAPADVWEPIPLAE